MALNLQQPPPYEQIYRNYLPGRFIGYTVEDYFASRFPYWELARWRAWIEEGRITVNGEAAIPGRVLKEHDFIVTNMGVRQEPLADRTLSVLYEDECVRVFNKGAPLPVHPCGRYFMNSMTELLKVEYPDEVPRPVQRLDAMTTGVIVFARNRETAKQVMHQFQNNAVDKEYLALVEGVPDRASFVVDAPVGKIKGSARGVGPEASDAKSAVTEFELLAECGGRSLLKAVPRTGRTNQIRVHLAHVGLPLVNDPVYGKPSGPEHEYGLHAWRLGFVGGGRQLAITAPFPKHFVPLAETAQLNI